jgi:DNA-binding LacI/PurR family transcriptional regulator
VVGWHVDHPDVDDVRTSDELGMARTVQHLVDLGHRRIAHLQGGPGLIALARREAYVDAMRVRGLGSHIQVVPCDGEDQIDGQRATRAIMAGGQDLPTALVAFNDDIAAAAISVLAQQGIDVPGDMSVVGFDDGALARTPGIDLTSVRQVPHEMARRAVDRIVERSAGEQVLEREIVFDPHLVVRSTSAPVARHEPDTAAELVGDLGVADRAGGTSGKG